MRKFITILSILSLLLFSINSYAQSQVDQRGPNELNLSISKITVPDIAEVVGDILGMSITAGQWKIDNLDCTGAFNLEYLHHLNSKWAIGGILNYEHWDANKFINNEYDGRYHADIASAMVAGKRYWFAGSRCSIYSKLALGGMIYANSIDNNSFNVAYQASPFGMIVGNGNWRFFTEVGFGMQGLVAAGLNIRF